MAKLEMELSSDRPEMIETEREREVSRLATSDEEWNVKIICNHCSELDDFQNLFYTPLLLRTERRWLPSSYECGKTRVLLCPRCSLLNE